MSRPPSAWDRLGAAATSADGGARTLVPVLGSGFVTQAIMEGVRARGRAGGPRPLDWLELLRGVASEFGLSRATGHIAHDIPGQTTLLWDSMVAELATTSRAGAVGQSRAAHQWERALRRAVAERLIDDRLAVRLSRPFVRSFLKLGWEDVLTFNFDSVLLPDAARPEPQSTGPAARAALAHGGPRARVWFPHGHASDPDSIVLGAHAYGTRLTAMRAAFGEHARLAPKRRTRVQPTSWVGVALERPLLFVGLSLSREEWTIWWLLAQRARFLARRPPADRPPAFVFVRRPPHDANLEAHASFATLARACDLLGIELCTFSDFGPGWRRLRAALDW